MIEKVHSLAVSDPPVAANSFACVMGRPVPMKGQPRMQLAKICVSEVKDGRIISGPFHR